MVRFVLPLLAASALAGAAHAQTGDRYGPSHAVSAPVAVVASVGAPPAPALRRLSWPGKSELRPALAPEGYAATTPTPAPIALSRPRTVAPAPAAPRVAALRAPLYIQPAPAPVHVTAAPAPSVAPAIVPPAPAPPTTLPPPLATPSANALPPPTVGRYGYVGPGRGPVAQSTAPASSAPPPPAASGLGAPRPPAYARGYVMPAASSASAPASAPALVPAPPATPLARADGGRRYSVHREYGMEPDPVPVPPQFFATSAPDLSAPETDPVVPRTGSAASRSAVNAARLAASAPGA